MNSELDPGKLIDADATRISRRLFADERIYERELERVFARSWLFLAHTSELNCPGRFVTTTMGETPVIVTRAQDGRIHAFINSCSHRGLPVCRVDRGLADGFTCPYHNWRYDLAGRLTGVPRRDIFGAGFDPTDHGLAPVAQVAEYHGLVFGCLDAGAESLERYLGDMRFYLDCMLDRDPDGTEVLGAPQRWTMRANWKMPAENQTGDQYHAPLLHASVMPPGQTDYQHDGTGFNFATDRGHGGSVRLLPPQSADRERILGLETLAAMDPRVLDWFLTAQQRVEQRLGPVRARLRPLNYNVFPNFSLIWPMFTFRLASPRAPGEVEIASWCVVDRSAPDYVRAAALRTYTRAFGPAGTVEMEDGEAWAQQHRGCRIRALEDRPLLYGTLTGSEGPHPDLPGTVSPALADHNIRSFYQRWRQLMATAP